MIESGNATLPDLGAIREVASVTVAHAATALSWLRNRAVMIAVPELLLTRVHEVPRSFQGYSKDLLHVQLQIVGQIPGSILILMPRKDVRLLASRGMPVTATLAGSGTARCGPICR